MRYNAFISYRHSELDMFVAKQIHKRLETFRVPRSVAKKTGKKKIKRVFRDQEELPIGSDLGNNITGALQESEYLIIICSPRTPESYWVQKEIETFIDMHGREHILAVLIEGEPEDSFPEQILVDDNGNPVEPLAADVRGINKKEVLKKIRSEILRLAAPVLGCSYDDLRQRHRERKMRRIAAFSSGIAVFGVAFGAYSAYNTMLINQNYKAKQKNQSKYLADTALALYEQGDRKTAAQIAMEALPVYEEKPYVEEAEYVLGQALNSYQTNSVIKKDCILSHDTYVKDLVSNSNAKYLVTIDGANSIYLWDTEKNSLVKKINSRLDQDSRITEISDIYVREDSILVTDSRGVYLLDFSGDIIWESEELMYITDTSYSAVADKLIVAETKAFYVFDIPTGEEKKYECDLEIYSIEDVAWNGDGSKFAVAYELAEEGSGVVQVYDTDGGKAKSLKTYGNCAERVIFSEGTDNIVTYSTRFTRTSYFNDADVGVIESFKINADTNKPKLLWQDKIQSVKDTGCLILKSRVCEDQVTGTELKQTVLAYENMLYTWDSETGETCSKIAMGSTIRNVFLGTLQDIAIIAEKSGEIEITETMGNTSELSITIPVGIEISKMGIGPGGSYVIAGVNSNNVMLMKYHEGAGKKDVASYDRRIESVHTSYTEDTYAVDALNSMDNEVISFYRSDTDEKIAEWDVSEYGYIQPAGFMDDGHYALLDNSGSIHIYDLNSQSANVIAPIQGEHIKMQVNKKTGQLIVYSQSECMLLDGITGKVLTKDDLDFLQDYHAYFDGKNYYCFSEDMSRISVCCGDFTIKVIDVKEKKVLCEIPFCKAGDICMRFLNDSGKIIVYGDDFLLKVYDIESGSLDYMSKYTFLELKDVEVFSEENKLTLYCEDGIYVLSSDNYNRIAFIEEGKACMIKKDQVYTSYTNELYKFPYMKLEDLLKEAKDQFGDARLTKQQRIQYNIE